MKPISGKRRYAVTSVDRTHHHYMIEAVRSGCEVISEKPLTIDAPRCQAIVDAVRETGRRVTVTFNYRYAPRNARVKRLLDEGAIGSALSANLAFERGLPVDVTGLVRL